MDQQTSPAKTKIFFPNLDGLRFISFFVVFLYHCYMSFFSYLKKSDPDTFSIIKLLFGHGNLGVNFFFVLSGFLITYLLIREKELKGKIHVGNFYIRRILRIWPLYFMCLAIGFLVFPAFKSFMGEPYSEPANAWYYLFFAANFDYMHIWPSMPNALMLSVLWSVAVEEQFYLTWPLILGAISLRRYKFVFPAIMLFSLVFRSFYTSSTEEVYAVRYFHTFSVIGDMALGGLFAYLCSYESKFKKFVVEMPKAIIAIIYVAAIGISIFKHVIFTSGVPVIFERLVIGFFFGMIILEQNFSRKSFFKMGQFKTISKLGVYTYGLYCLHLIGMYLSQKLTTALQLDQTRTMVAYGSVLVALLFSIGISLASYHFFEKWFLTIKSKFAVIVTK
ncbi:MAG TPA: acyltransferase [Flavitalea sp.]|nr:acyltransferase [Flavitalea sp.]